MTSFVPLDPVIQGARRVFCCHSASLGHPHPPNSLAAVRACVEGGAVRVELDLRFLADDTMLVFHDSTLDGVSTGSGPVEALESAGAHALRYRAAPEHPIPLFEDAVRILAGTGILLQVDLKLLAPISPERVRRLAAALDPLRGHVIVGSQAHWNLRAIASAGLPVAFDPTLHWHRNPGDEPPGYLPSMQGHHGLRDDAPLAHLPGIAAADYFGSRVDDLVGLVPSAAEWQVDVGTIRHMATHGFALGCELQRRGIELAAWTVRDEGPGVTAALLADLFSLGVTTVITDSPQTLAKYTQAPA